VRTVAYGLTPVGIRAILGDTNERNTMSTITDRIPAPLILPGDIVEHMGLTVESVEPIPGAIMLHWLGGGHTTYSPHALLTVTR
jgi:hypothetical protein